MWEEFVRQVIREWGPVGISVAVVIGVVSQALRANRLNQERVLDYQKQSDRERMQMIEMNKEITNRYIDSMEKTVENVSVGMEKISTAVTTLANTVEENNCRLADHTEKLRDIAQCVDTLTERVREKDNTKLNV